MSVISIQSHVAYGYVGNKAAVYPLQSMGHDVWPVYTVQFSNHTGYGKWQGEVFSADHIRSVVQGIEDIGQLSACQAVLSGYMGSLEICGAVAGIVKDLKSKNPNVIYLCDPVIGNTNCFVKPEVLGFFKKKLSADIITPNQYEAETLSGIKIENAASLKAVAKHFHGLGIGIVVITGVKLPDKPANLCVFVSDGHAAHVIKTREYKFSTPVNGTGDLLSSLFLGSYLIEKNPVLAVQRAVAFMQKVLQNTFDAKSRELQVLSVRYGLSEVGALPEAVAVF